jgi:pimeloyl-ACP methyl ester carboxylesterase
LRAVIDTRGQRVSALDRLYLLGSMPTLIVWGARDNTIPVAHGRQAHRAAPGSRFEILPNAAHFPNLEDPEGLAAVLRDFLETTEPVHIDDADWGGIVARRSPRARLRKAAA